MQEDFLYYVWQHKKFALESLYTTKHHPIRVKSVGQPNTNSGPDFFNAQLVIDGQLWAGNVEIHVKSSDWYLHNHEQNSAYDTVILHVVWEHNTEVYRADNSVVPTLELKPHVASGILKNYKRLITNQQGWIPCENQFKRVQTFQMAHWLERLYLERLEQKCSPVQARLEQTHHDWEAVMFWQLARAFGSKVNADAFWQLAKSFPFAVFRKIRHNLLDLEALLFGQSGLLEGEDHYVQSLKNRYAFFKQKYSLNRNGTMPMQFFRLRPPNFPTIRLAQLAQLYFTHDHVFSSLMQLEGPCDFYDFFSCGTSSFWDTHYSFGAASKKRSKTLSKRFIDLLIINAIIPMRYAYNKSQGMPQDVLLSLIRTIPPEQNSTVKKFQELKPISTSALDSQALLQLKSYYSDHRKCLDCAVGSALLNRNV